MATRTQHVQAEARGLALLAGFPRELPGPGTQAALRGSASSSSRSWWAVQLTWDADFAGSCRSPSEEHCELGNAVSEPTAEETEVQGVGSRPRSLGGGRDMTEPLAGTWPTLQELQTHPVPYRSENNGECTFKFPRSFIFVLLIPEEKIYL